MVAGTDTSAWTVKRNRPRSSASMASAAASPRTSPWAAWSGAPREKKAAPRSSPFLTSSTPVFWLSSIICQTSRSEASTISPVNDPGAARMTVSPSPLGRSSSSRAPKPKSKGPMLIRSPSSSRRRLTRAPLT